jgi:prevent-host-death family protein
MNAHITVTATEANRSLSRLLRQVAQGKRVEITSHGRAIARMVPIEPESEEIRRTRKLAALAKLQEHWATVEPVTVGNWTREELYDRD